MQVVSITNVKADILHTKKKMYFDISWYIITNDLNLNDRK